MGKAVFNPTPKPGGPGGPRGTGGQSTSGPPPKLTKQSMTRKSSRGK